MINSWMNFSLRIVPDTVEIDTSQVASSRPVDNTIRVKHRYNFKNEVVSEDLGIERRPSQVI
jgi:hypothetical protein